MELQNTPRPNSKISIWIKKSITARLLMVGFLTLVLLIPLSYISSLIAERSYRQNNVVKEINTKWGEDVLVYGPILKLPYKTYKEISLYNKKTKSYTTKTETEINYVYIFPEQLDVDTKVISKTLKRGNFESAVYTTNMSFKGYYKNVELDSKDIKSENIIWEKASFVVKTSNLKGIKGELNINTSRHNYPFETNFSNTKRNKIALDELESSFIKSDDIKSEISKNLNFNFKISYDGSEQIKLIPIGKTTSLKMNSNWANPSFTGEFLPLDSTKKISNDGFEAQWKVTHLNRAFSQIHLNSIPNLQSYAFGTKFLIMVDEFQQSERSAKYGFLVIGLTFLLFFLIQTLSKIDIHPFQYLMIGLALTMFYTLLVSISEHSNFLKAYLIAGISVISLITLYSKSILKLWKFPVFIGLSLTGLYTFIYTIIQLENYALLVGSIGLFIILAIIMFVSRKIDWNNN
jgi:inner membrane protein